MFGPCSLIRRKYQMTPGPRNAPADRSLEQLLNFGPRRRNLDVPRLLDVCHSREFLDVLNFLGANGPVSTPAECNSCSTSRPVFLSCFTSSAKRGLCSSFTETDRFTFAMVATIPRRDDEMSRVLNQEGHHTGDGQPAGEEPEHFYFLTSSLSRSKVIPILPRKFLSLMSSVRLDAVKEIGT
jgi:hypothetical protein